MEGVGHRLQAKTQRAPNCHRLLSHHFRHEIVPAQFGPTFMLRVPCLCRIVSFVQHGRFSGRPVENPRNAVLRAQPVPDRTHMVNPFIDYANFLPCGEVFGDQRLELPLPIFHVSATNHKDEWLPALLRQFGKIIIRSESCSAARFTQPLHVLQPFH